MTNALLLLGQQEPFVYGSLGGRTVSIVPADTAYDRPAMAPPPSTSTEAGQAWAAVREVSSQAVLEDFIRRFGDSFYGSLARARLEELKRNQVAAVLPPMAPPPPEYNLPKFPSLPPAASASYVLPRNLFGTQSSVGQVVAAIIAALERTGYVERSFFSTEAGGVALVTRLERINDDGFREMKENVGLDSCRNTTQVWT